MKEVFGWFVFIVGIIAFVLFYLYPVYISKRRVGVKSATVRPKPLLFDSRYGLCVIEDAVPLSTDSFKLELFSESGQTYYSKYYNDEFIVPNWSNVLAGSGRQLYMTKVDYNNMNSKPNTELDTIKELRDKVELHKSKAKIQINDPDEKARNIIDLMTQLESARTKRKEAS